jgi:hypothetical protein
MKRALLLLLFATAARADSLADTRAALARLGAQDAIRATYEIHRTAANDGKFNNDKFTANAAIDLEADRGALRVSFSRTLLEQAEREQAARNLNSKHPTPVLSVLREIDPIGTATMVDFAPQLLRMMEKAKVVEDRGGTWAGKPAHILILKLSDPPESGFGKNTYLENRLTLWLGGDAVPLAAELLRSTRFSLLIIRFTSSAKRSWHFATVGDRLVAVRHESQEHGSGMGQKVNETLVETVKVQQP